MTENKPQSYAVAHEAQPRNVGVGERRSVPRSASMKAFCSTKMIVTSVLVLVQTSLGAGESAIHGPSPELLARLRYKSLLLGSAEVRLGMSSNDVLAALTKANLHGMWMITDPHAPSVRQYNVAGTNSFGKYELKGHVFFRDGIAICIDRVVASFNDDDRGTEFARRFVELLWIVQMEQGTDKIVSNWPTIIGDVHELTFDVEPGNKRISCSATGGKVRVEGKVVDSLAPPQAELSESIYCLDSMSEISESSGLRKFWGMLKE